MGHRRSEGLQPRKTSLYNEIRHIIIRLTTGVLITNKKTSRLVVKNLLHLGPVSSLTFRPSVHPTPGPELTRKTVEATGCVILIHTVGHPLRRLLFRPVTDLSSQRVHPNHSTRNPTPCFFRRDSQTGVFVSLRNRKGPAHRSLPSIRSTSQRTPPTPDCQDGCRGRSQSVTG